VSTEEQAHQHARSRAGDASAEPRRASPLAAKPLDGVLVVALEQAVAALNITPWLEWFLGCLDRAFDGAETILAAVLMKADFWKTHAAVKINDRQRDILNRLLDGFEGKLTSSQWALIEKCSADTALRDINELLEFGILQKDGAGGRSTSYSLA
jgi:Fic family protein